MGKVNAVAVVGRRCRSCFFYFGPQPTAESLWKVYEVIRDDVGGGDKG
jgi:hypothetical protein